MKKVLVTDDSMFMRKALQRILVKNGYTVVAEAENGKDAVEKYKELIPDFVTMDITMQEMNGLEALEKIIEYDKNARILMVSAMGQAAYVTEAVDKGAKGFVVKPFDEAAVIAAISKLGL